MTVFLVSDGQPVGTSLRYTVLLRLTQSRRARLYEATRAIVAGDLHEAGRRIKEKPMPILDERQSEIAAKIVPPAKLAHFVLRTFRFEEMVDWYKLVMHARPAYENPGLSFLTYDEEHHRIAIVAIPDLREQDKSDVGLHHIAFTYDSLNDLLENYQRLKDLGIEPAWAVNHGPTTSLYYRDPDGNHLEFQVENFETVEESTQFFFTEAFDINPIGVEFDPDQLRRRMLAGEDERELKKRPASGPVGLEAVKI